MLICVPVFQLYRTSGDISESIPCPMWQSAQTKLGLRSIQTLLWPAFVSCSFAMLSHRSEAGLLSPSASFSSSENISVFMQTILCLVRKHCHQLFPYKEKAYPWPMVTELLSTRYVSYLESCSSIIRSGTNPRLKYSSSWSAIPDCISPRLVSQKPGPYHVLWPARGSSSSSLISWAGKVTSLSLLPYNNYGNLNLCLFGALCYHYC